MKQADIIVLEASGYNHIHIRLNVPACVHTCILVCMLVCMLVHLCLCVSNHPHTNIPSHACVHEGFWSSWSCIMMPCKLCACVHAYAQLLMVTHSCMKVWKCTDQRTHVYVHLHAHFMAPTSWQQQSCSYTQRLYPLLFLQHLAVIPVDLQRLYPAVITASFT